MIPADTILCAISDTDDQAVMDARGYITERRLSKDDVVLAKSDGCVIVRARRPLMLCR